MPADAAALVVLRAPERLITTATELVWLGVQEPDADQAMRAEIDGFLRSWIGVALGSASSVTAYYAASPEQLGVIIEGAAGQLDGPELPGHGGTSFRVVDESAGILGVTRGAQLLLGNRPALVAMLDALDGKRPALVDAPGELGTLLARESVGASFAAVAELAGLPPDLAQPAVGLGVERGYLGIDDAGLRAVALGPPSACSPSRA